MSGHSSGGGGRYHSSSAPYYGGGGGGMDGRGGPPPRRGTGGGGGGGSYHHPPPPQGRHFPPGSGPPPPRGNDPYRRGPPPHAVPPHHGPNNNNNNHGGPPPPHFRDRGGGRGPPLPPPPRGGGGPPPPGGGDRPRRRTHPHSTLIHFRSYDEEYAWVEERRRKRKERPSKFDLSPSQLLALAANAAAATTATVDGSSAAQGPPAALLAAAAAAQTNPQQTRHARRLYVGNLPLTATEEELHDLFRQAIEIALDPAQRADYLAEDPVLNVYINHERRFCFLEFRTVEMATACMALDGLEVQGVPVKVKRPNDYNAAMAPLVHPSAIPNLDVSKLGIISGTVLDGPNKIFIGGLHYHWAEPVVLELLQAFGKVKAFHLVKNEPDSSSSKGYCFVEYADPAVTLIAVQGLNGMSIGEGKSLTARLAAERTGDMGAGVVVPAVLNLAALTTVVESANGMAPPLDRNIVAGYDVETLVDAAMGMCPMPTAPVYLDAFGQPLTRILPAPLLALAPATAAPLATLPAANTFLPSNNQQQQGSNSNGESQRKSRVLVLRNMVTDEDLATEEDYQGLLEEVQEECAKFGVLRTIRIPRQEGQGVEATAIRKIFLEYATVEDAVRAEQELAGRQFGSNVVETAFHPEDDYQAGRLY